MTETGWYTGKQKPVRVGPYKRKFNLKAFFRYSWWDGHQWGFDCYLKEDAKVYKNWPSDCQNRPWCGLTGELK